METKDIIYELRTKKGLSQEELAEKVFVTRQAVSRWETGETIPNIDTLKLLSKLFDVSINTLLGSPRELVCQCCGMPLEDCTTSRETDGNFNEEYCKWCYADGEYTLDIWKRYAEIGGKEKLEEFKQQLIHEFNTLLHIEGLPKVENLNVLSGEFINMEYTLPNGEKVKFLDDKQTYLGSQINVKTPLRFRMIPQRSFLSLFIYYKFGVFAVFFVCANEEKVHISGNAKASVTAKFTFKLTSKIGSIIIKEFHYLSVGQTIFQIDKATGQHIQIFHLGQAFNMK